MSYFSTVAHVIKIMSGICAVVCEQFELFFFFGVELFFLCSELFFFLWFELFLLESIKSSPTKP